MSHYGNPRLDDLVAIDEAHLSLIYGLVVAGKPRAILEIGFGSGRAFRQICKAAKFNAIPIAYTVVDNWADFSGVEPPSIKNEPDYRLASFITSSEEDFVRSCDSKFDFILSDGDHLRSHEWFLDVYERLLNPQGILVCHDVTNSSMFPELASILKVVEEQGLHYMLFNNSSRKDERCERGLLVVKKHE